ncbi:replication protein A 70 kDa DNA-binding subunit B-like [Bidens hawaiensis]|uniref:replication protein A 70 kDa DNA-binding subunit B-like n=1 Tax=Bidens hawaiensis TaxID=980011 RepID=UPI00404B97C4
MHPFKRGVAVGRFKGGPDLASSEIVSGREFDCEHVENGGHGKLSFDGGEGRGGSVGGHDGEGEGEGDQPIENKMEAKNFTMFNSLDVSNNDCLLKVHILRLWRLKDNNKPGEDWSIEMILQDETGHRMQAYVRKPCIPKHDVWLAENRSLIVRKASLGANLSTYRVVDSPHKLCFTSETRLSICDEFKGHIYGLSFATFDDIKANNVTQNGTIDVIGHVSKFFDNKNSFFREAQHQNRRTMEFADLSGKTIYLTLWDDYLKQLIKYVSDNPNKEYLIIVLKFARVKYYGENVYVQNSYGNQVSRLMINDYLYEVIDYKKRLLEISSKVNVEVPKPVGSSKLLTVKDEFLKKYPFYSISDLCTILEAKNVVIIGTIKYILGNKEWYYNGCKRCSRKITSTFVNGVKVYECKNSSCNSQGVTTGPRFRIPIRVQDTTGVVSLTLFDRDARQLFNKPADEFVTTDVEVDPMHTFPKELNTILEKKFAFIVEVSDYNIRNSYDVYSVTKLTDDQDVLNDLDKQLAHGQPNDNQSLIVGSSSNLKSTENELLTPSSDHFTPISNSEDIIPDCLSSLDGKAISLPEVDVKLKRKLDDTYDGQDDTGMSATKTKVDEQPVVDANVDDVDI